MAIDEVPPPRHRRLPHASLAPHRVESPAMALLEKLDVAAVRRLTGRGVHPERGSEAPQAQGGSHDGGGNAQRRDRRRGLAAGEGRARPRPDLPRRSINTKRSSTSIRGAGAHAQSGEEHAVGRPPRPSPSARRRATCPGNCAAVIAASSGTRRPCWAKPPGTCVLARPRGTSARIKGRGSQARRSRIAPRPQASSGSPADYLALALLVRADGWRRRVTTDG